MHPLITHPLSLPPSLPPSLPASLQVIHPQSIIHSMIETQDTSVIGQLGREGGKEGGREGEKVLLSP